MDKHDSSPVLTSVDLGSHTGRMLIAQWVEEEAFLTPLLRRRVYIRLARDFEAPPARTIKEAAVERATRCLEEFKRIIEGFALSYVQVVATGIVREAANRDEVMDRFRQRTNLPVRLLSGEEEARLTGIGVCQSVDMGGNPFIAFDLGGGSTEFLLVGTQSPRAVSVPLGAALLTERYLVADPPRDEEMGRAKARVLEALRQSLTAHFHCDPLRLIGTGGTVTTLAALVHGIGADEISPERMNGLVLERTRLEHLFSQLSTMPLAERLRMPGLDPGRADVILGGTLAVIEILKFFGAPEIMISLSDLLEGVLFERLGYSLPGDIV